MAFLRRQYRTIAFFAILTAILLAVIVGAVSEGVNGYGGYSSPESGASMYCPGLTKANGGGLTLAQCEKAVVHIQAWSATSTTYTMPPSFKVKAE